MSVRVSEDEAALIDAARGPAERGTWLREAALAAASPAPRRNPKACKHENMRLTKGVCPDCLQYAAKK